MDESEKNTGFEIQRLSLIDVSYEDDCLINVSSSFFPAALDRSFSENQEQESVRSMTSSAAPGNEASPFKCCEEASKDFEPLESSKSEKTEKYNLRQSLAWDNAFFTSEGFLEPEELSSMIGGGGCTGKIVKSVLPGIQEDALSRRSTDSLSTLASDTLTMRSLEADFFEDIRASIQKSTPMSTRPTSKGNDIIGATDSPTTQSSKKAGLSSGNKIKLKVVHKKPVVPSQASGKAIKQVSVHTQSSQSVVTNRVSTTRKPPKVLGKVLQTSTKGASLSANNRKTEKDNPKVSPVGTRGAAASKTCPGGSRNALPKPALPSRSLRSSVASKKELSSSRSSFDSSGSGSSDNSRLSMNSINLRNAPGTCSSPAGSTVKSRSRMASKNNVLPKSSLKSVTKLSPSVSPASSISEWSPGSSASRSSVNQMPNNMRVSLNSRSVKGLSVGSNPSQLLESIDNWKDKWSVEDDAKARGAVKGTSTGTTALHPAKPTGLRMPSPKIGFFDGVRSSVRSSRSGSMQSHSGLSSTLSSPRTGSSTISSGGSNTLKSGKLQSARTAMTMKSTKPNVQPKMLNIKARSSLPLQEPSNSTKVPTPSRSLKGTPKISSPEPVLSEKNCSPKNTVSSESYRDHAPVVKSSVVNEKLSALSNSSFSAEVENINPSQKASGDVNCSGNIPKNETGNSKFQDQIGSPIKDEVRDIHVVTEKTVISISPGTLSQNC